MAPQRTGTGVERPATNASPGRHAVLTVQESRRGLPLVPGGRAVDAELLAASGLDAVVAQGLEALRGATTLEEAAAVARTAGQRLWDTAVARAQGQRGPGAAGAAAGEVAGDAGSRWDSYDDRPLYWARLALSAAVRTLDAGFLVLTQHRQGLLHLLDRASRGMAGPLWPRGAPAGATRVAVTGFDTFGLDESLRHSNPFGAAALQVAGRTLDTPQGPVVVRAVVLPVSYADFDQGVVEDAFGPVLVPGADRADLIMTISQTARGRMDVEKWAAGARGGWPDNDRLQHFGPVSRPAHWPAPFDSPDWIATTLPWAQMVAAGTGPWPVVLREGIAEWPAGTFPDPAQVRTRPDPSPGSRAASGTGGDYLSNESMYRSNRLRQGVGAWDVPGGHLHVSALEYPADPSALTDDAFEGDRWAVVQQTVALVLAAGAAVRAARGQRGA